MGRPRDVVHYTFDGGEADPQYASRADSEVWIRTVKTARNVRIVNGGGCKRRPGLDRVTTQASPARLKRFESRLGSKRMLAFRHQSLQIFRTDRTTDSTLTGCPWELDDLALLQFAAVNEQVIVTSRSFFPQIVERSIAGVWSFDDFAFSEGPDNTTAQPYYRFRDTRGIALQPSARTGSITLQADAAVFSASHVNTKIRILKREILITAVTDSDTATGTVQQELYPTMRWEVASTTGFAPGQALTTTVDEIEAEVYAVVDSTHIDVLYTSGFTDPTTTTNKVVGPFASTDFVGAAGVVGEAATTQWDEQLISAVRGYPAGCCFHKGRLCFYDFPAAPELIAMSVTNVPESFDTGTGIDTDAIIDGPGDATGKRVRWLISTEQLIALTEVGSYYVGEGAGQSLTPTTTEFFKVGPEPAGECNPVLAAEGALYFEANADRLMLLEPTGQVRRSWQSNELSALSPQLIVAPYRALLVDGGNWGPERYVVAVNSDGALAVMHYRRRADLVGWMGWETDGSFIDIEWLDGEVWCSMQRDGYYTIETFDEDRLLDESAVVTSVEGMAPEHAEWINRDIALVWRVTEGGEDRRIDLGTVFAATGTGALPNAPTSSRTYEGGRRFTPNLTLWAPIDPEVGPSMWTRIKRFAIDVLESGGFYVEGRRFTAYRTGDDVDEPPPLRTGWRASKLLGRKRDYTVEITQIEAAPLQIRAISVKTS